MSALAVVGMLGAGQGPAGADEVLVPVLLKDLNPGTASSSPSRFTEVGGSVLFAASDPASGAELRKTDGTAAGTTLVKDINPGAGSSMTTSRFAALGSTLYFGANDAVNGNELWKSDGTAAGTVVVKDINPGSSSSNAGNFIVAGSKMFFTATDGTAGTELWTTDGTAEGTFMVKDINPGSGGNFATTPPAMTVVGNTLYFPASDGTAAGGHGLELWKSDGTLAGTVLVKDIRPGTAASSINNFSFATLNATTVVFTANDGGAAGSELWRSDGTEAGTVLVKDIWPGTSSSSPQNTVVVNGVAYFNASTGISPGPGIGMGSEFYKSDGTAAGTVLVKDIVPGGNGSFAQNFTGLGTDVLFAAQADGSGNMELFKTDGTAAGTVLLKDINVGAASSSPANFGVVGSTAYFSASNGTTTGLQGTELWKTDGTTAGTVMTLDINPGTAGSSPTSVTPALGIAFFAATSANTGNEPYRLRTNAAPTAADDAFSTRVNSPHTFPAPGVLANDTDPDGDALTASRTVQAANGTAVVNTDGSFTYTPNTGFSGTDTFTYTASDGGGGLATGTVTMTVAGTNTAPVANNDAHGTNEDTQLVVTAPGVVGNDTDADADTLTARLTGRTVTDGSTTFASNITSPNANFTALDVGASISGGGIPPAGARIATVTSPTTATITGFVAGQVTGATWQITPQPGARTATAHGDVTLNPDGSFTYNPAVNYNGPDTFGYIADDGYGLTATATVTITVAPVNDAPVAGADTYTTNATDPPLVVAAPGVLANDTDAEGEALTASSPSTPANGAVALNPDGSFTYTPSGTFAGVDTFTYTVSDVNSASATGTVSINVRNENSVDSVKGSACAYYTNVGLFGGGAALRGCGQNATQPATAASPAVNLPPTGSATAITAFDTDGAEAEYGPATIFGGRWPEDVAGAPASGPLAASTQGTAAGGTVTSSADISLHPTPIEVGCYAGFTPPCTSPGGFGPWPVEGDSAHVECTASKTGVSGFTTFSNAQVALATDADGNPTVFEDVPENPPVNYTRSGVISNVGDVFTVVYNQHVINSDGSLTVNAAHMYLMGPTAVGDVVKGSVTCGTTPSPLTPVTDTVAPTCSAAIVLTVSATNPAPRVPREELVGVLDSGKPEVRTVTDGVTTNGSTTVTSATAAFATTDVGATITGPGIPAGARIATRTSATAVVMTQASTATATGVGLEITRQAGGIQTITNVQATNATVTVPTFTPGTTGPVALTAKRTNASQPMYWSFDATDGAGNVTHCSGAMVPPVAEDDSYTTGEDTPLNVAAPGVLGNDTAATSGTFTAGSPSTPTNGSVALNADGSFTYTPNANYNGPDSFTYTATDPSGGTDTATVNITVAPVNDAPVAVDDTATTTEDTAVTVAVPGVLGNDTDADGNALSATKVNDPANGTVTLNADGSFTYTPNGSFNGSDSFTYKANDGTADSNVGTVTITIAPVNDAPEAVADAYSTSEDLPLVVAAPGVLGNDTDSDGDSLTAGSASTPANGTVALNPDGSFTYTPNANYNGSDSFTYTASDPNGGSDTATVTITVVPPSGPPTLSVSSVMVAEGDSGTTAMVFSVTRSGDVSGTTTVTHKTSGGTATVGTDYTAVASSPLTFAPGETSKDVPVNVNGDTTPEKPETLNLALSAPPKGTVLADSMGTGTIVNDDGAAYVAAENVVVAEGDAGTTAGSFTVTRYGNTTSGSTVKAKFGGGTATAGTDYTAVAEQTLEFAPGQESATVTFDIVGDTGAETNETFKLTLTALAVGTTVADPSATAYIDDDDGTTTAPPATFFSVTSLSLVEGDSGTSPAAFTVTRSGNTAGESTVTYRTSGGNATRDVDYTAVPSTPLVFAAGETTKTVTIDVTAETVPETDETVNLMLSGAPRGSVLGDGSGTAAIVNDDGAAFVAVSNVHVTEGDSGTTAVEVTVTRYGNTTGAVTVKAKTSGGSATAGTDYAAISDVTVDFAAGQTTATVIVNVVGDTTVEPNETFNVMLYAPGPGVTLADTSGLATIVNDD